MKKYNKILKIRCNIEESNGLNGKEFEKIVKYLKCFYDDEIVNDTSKSMVLRYNNETGVVDCMILNILNEHDEYEQLIKNEGLKYITQIYNFFSIKMSDEDFLQWNIQEKSEEKIKELKEDFEFYREYYDTETCVYDDERFECLAKNFGNQFTHDDYWDNKEI